MQIVKKMVMGGLVLVGALVTSEAGAKDQAGWIVQGTGSGIVDGQKYSMKRIDENSWLGFKERTGANFGWDSSANNGMTIKRKGGSGNLKCGEVFGLFIEKEWMIYEKQTFGINISSRTQLAKDEWYQWKFVCPAGQDVALNANLTLVNTVANDSLVGCKRVVGVNLCWAGDTVTVAGRVYRKADAPH